MWNRILGTQVFTAKKIEKCQLAVRLGTCLFSDSNQDMFAHDTGTFLYPSGGVCLKRIDLHVCM